jgi:hypothetical protein
MAEVWLVCEGTPDSADLAVLKPVMTTVLAADIVVEPSFGNNPAAVARFLEAQRGGRAGYVIDRDYVSREKADHSFRDGKPGFIWRRHSIENYLLLPSVIIRAFHRLRERFEKQFGATLPHWVLALPSDAAQIADVLRECARQRAGKETCRLAMHRLWEDISESAGRVQKRVPDASEAADDTDPAGWREALSKETRRVREAAERTRCEPHLDDAAVAKRFDHQYAIVTTTSYLVDMEFLFDFHGKELLSQFRNWLETLGVRFRFERLRAELASALVEVYDENRAIHGTDDFRELADGMRAIAGLPPIE